ncbi:MAG: glycosyltransferase family 2 protein [Bacteroidota bacterium]
MSQLSEIKISIIIVNYNGSGFLRACLDSVNPELTDDCEVIMVDNGSVDGSAAFVHGTFSWVKVIESGKNLGFAEGNNFGVRHAKGDLIVLLNNDTIVHPGWLKGLRDAVLEEDVAAASSLIKTTGIPERYYEKNGSVNFLGQNIMRVFDEPTDIFYAGGASMIFKRNILGEPFDNDYFVYSEDVYLGLRVRFMGLHVKHTNDSRLDHLGNGTSKHQQSGFLTFYQERNRLLNLFLFFSVTTIIRTFPYILVNCAAKIFLALMGRKYSLNGLLHAYGWFLVRIPLIMRKRDLLAKEKKVTDSEVIAKMSGKLTDGETLPGKIVNFIMLTYCRIVRLKVIELS